MSDDEYLIEGFSVYKNLSDRWTRLSRVFDTQAQAEQYQADLPQDWETEVREVRK